MTIQLSSLEKKSEFSQCYLTLSAITSVEFHVHMVRPILNLVTFINVLKKTAMNFCQYKYIHTILAIEKLNV